METESRLLNSVKGALLCSVEKKAPYLYFYSIPLGGCIKKSAWAVKSYFDNEPKEFTPLKGFLSMVYVLTFGYVYYMIVLVPIQLNGITSKITAAFVAFILGLCCASSAQLRCVGLLMFSTFFTRAGMRPIRALVMVYVLAGPVENMILNGYQLVSTYACTTALEHNLSKAKYAMTYTPFQKALQNMKIDTTEIEEIVYTVKDIIKPIITEIEDESEIKTLQNANDYLDVLNNETKRSSELEKKYEILKEDSKARIHEKKYLKKLRYRCENLITSSTVNCMQIFDKVYKNCVDLVPAELVSYLCWPVKLHFLCNLYAELGGDSTCDPESAIPLGFGIAYNFLTKAEPLYFEDQCKGIPVNYRVKKLDIKVDVRGPLDAARGVVKEFVLRRDLAFSILTAIKRLLAIFATLRVFVSAQNFRSSYLKDADFNNFYITEYFKKIDARRHKKGKLTLLPLTKIELKCMVDPNKLSLGLRERVGVVNAASKVILEATGISAILIIDRVLWETMDIVRQHAKMEIQESGHHDLTVSVKGTGLVANFVRSVISEFKNRENVTFPQSNEDCLPNPHSTPDNKLDKIYGAFFLMFLMILFRGYLERFCMAICAYYFPKTEKKRILYLYNEMVRKRIKFQQKKAKKLTRRVKENRLSHQMNLFLLVRLKQPKLFRCLIWIPLARKYCLICEEPENRPGKNKNVVECPNCHYVYCISCWKETEETCYGCYPPSLDSEDYSGREEGSCWGY